MKYPRFQSHSLAGVGVIRHDARTEKTINKSNYSLKLGNNGKEKENIIRFVRYPERGRG